MNFKFKLFLSLAFVFSVSAFLPASAYAFSRAPIFNININEHATGGDANFSFHISANTPPNAEPYFTEDFAIQTDNGIGSHNTSSGSAIGDSYYITQDSSLGWQAPSVSCTSSNPSVTSAPLPGGVLITAAPFSSITCDFVNASGPAKNTPVIIIPGVLGSAYKNGVWTIDPVFHVYDNLIETLEANGYSSTTDLFTFPYDWKNSNIDTAHLLKQKIDAVKTLCGCAKVDIVAHSMGGLVARAYAESSEYGNDIDQLIFLGTPQRGAPKDYLMWEAGETPTSNTSFYLKSYLKKDAKHKGYNNVFDYVKGWPVISAQQLLPTYDYLENADTGQMIHYPSNYPQNTFLENLNGGLVNLLSSDINITNVIGNTGTSTISQIRIEPSTSQTLWKDGYPQGFDNFVGDHGLVPGVGDGSVPKESSTLGSAFDYEIQSEHTALPTNAEEKIYSKIHGGLLTTTIKKPMLARILFAKIFSPADIVVVAPDGKRVGKDFTTGQEINEIPGAFYSGFDTDDEYVTIPDPIDGQYHIETIGTGGGGSYTLVASNISDSASTDASFTGATAPNLKTSVSFGINSSTSTIQMKPDDIISPTISITSPLAGDYERSKTITITATSTDNVGIATSSMMFGSTTIQNRSSIDLFYQKLGTTTISAFATDFQNNIGSTSVAIRIISTPDSTISDIQRAFALNWIKKKNISDELVDKMQKIIKTQTKIDTIEEILPNKKKVVKQVARLEKVLDKTFAKALLLDLKAYQKDKISDQGYNLLKEDLEWMINN